MPGEFHKVRIIEEEGEGGQRGEYYLDGHQIKGVRGHVYDNHLGSVKILTLELIVKDVEIQSVPLEALEANKK